MVLPQQDMLEGSIQQTLQVECLACCPLVEQDGRMSYQVFLPEQVEAVQERLAGGVAADPHVGLARLRQQPGKESEGVQSLSEICLQGHITDRAQQCVDVLTLRHRFQSVGC